MHTCSPLEFGDPIDVRFDNLFLFQGTRRSWNPSDLPSAPTSTRPSGKCTLELASWLFPWPLRMCRTPSRHRVWISCFYTRVFPAAWTGKTPSDCFPVFVFMRNEEVRLSCACRDMTIRACVVLLVPFVARQGMHHEERCCCLLMCLTKIRKIPATMA